MPEGQFNVSNPATDYTVFLLRLVQVHDAMDDLHRRVATEERDLVWKLFGGRFWAFGGVDLHCWLRPLYILIYKEIKAQNFLKCS